MATHASSSRSTIPQAPVRTDAAHDHAGTLFGLPIGLVLSLSAGAALAIGWTGETFFALARPVGIGLYVLALVAGGWDATKDAVGATLEGRFDIDVLMVVAALGAVSLGRWADGALLLFLFSLGHALEHYAMDRARGAIHALADLTPSTARVRRDGRDVEIPTSELTIGETVVVRPGERIPADGDVTEGTSSVDQAPITGESMPVGKRPGESVFAGTINGEGSLIVETTKAPEDTTLARVVRTVENAQSAKAPSQRFTDRFQRIFTPIVLGATVLVITLPPLFGVPFEDSFLRAMTLLVAASPCALALATPSAVLSGIARAARTGVLVKGGVHLENAGTAKVVVFDKTGTLTRGRPAVTDLVPANVGEDDLLALAAAVEAKSGQPLAAAIVRAAEERGHDLPTAGDLASTTGRGVQADVGGRTIRIGSPTFLNGNGSRISSELTDRTEALEREGKTVIFVAANETVLGAIALRDEPRPEAAAVVRRLRDMGIERTVMLTGDREAVARSIGDALGIDEVHAELMPDDKVRLVKQLDERYGDVIMVGDGVNDAPAMVQATVGVAMGGAGTDVALETADIALMADDLTKLPYAIALSRGSRRMIVQNLAIALGVIALLVPSALLGIAGIGIAIVLHESSTLVVVANALRLLGFRDRTAPSAA